MLCSSTVSGTTRDWGMWENGCSICTVLESHSSFGRDGLNINLG